MLRQTNHLTKRFNVERGHTLEVYERDGGYKQAERALNAAKAFACKAGG